jgi:hypothetical protein
MSKRTNWFVVVIVAALLAAVVVLAGAVVPGATGKASAAAAATPSPSPVVLQVERNGHVAKAYSLDQLEAMTPFAGFAGYMGKAVHGPDAVTGAKVTDIVKDALGMPLTAAETVDVAEVVPPPNAYDQVFAGAQLLDPLTGFTLYDATTTNPITPTGTLAAVLIYSDPALNVMPADSGPLRFVIADATSENGVMTGKYSVSSVNVLNVIDHVTITLGAKHSSVKVGRTLTFGGKVTNAVAKDVTIKLRLVKGTKFVLKKTGRITSAGGFKLSIKGVKAGKWTFVVTYKVGKTTFVSNSVKVTVRK